MTSNYSEGGWQKWERLSLSLSTTSYMYTPCGADFSKANNSPEDYAIHFNCVFVSDPSSVELNIDGTTDKCSKGEDINFIFTGFTLSGKVNYKILSA